MFNNGTQSKTLYADCLSFSIFLYLSPFFLKMDKNMSLSQDSLKILESFMITSKPKNFRYMISH